jgi:hypothetical protein
MILQAIKRGVSEEKIARALNVDVPNIISRRDLLQGISPEAADLLKDKIVARSVFKIMKRMKPERQIEVATLMRDVNIYSMSYVQALLAATPKGKLVDPENPKKIKGLTDEQMLRMEAEMGSLHGQYRLIEDSFGTNVLTLTVAKTYLSKLLNNARIIKYLTRHHPEYMTEFQKIAEMTSLGRSAAV